MEEIRKLKMTEDEKEALRGLAKICASHFCCKECDCVLYKFCHRDITTSLEDCIDTLLQEIEE